MVVLKLALPAAVLMAAIPVAPGALHAQSSTALDQAVLAELNADKRTEVQSRASAGNNTVREVLETTLLNSIKLRYPANRILALDFDRGAAVVETPDNQMRLVSFDRKTLAVTN